MSSAALVAVTSSLAVIVLCAGTYAVVERPDSFAGRLEAYVALVREKKTGSRRERGGITWLLAFVERLLRGQSLSLRLALHLAQANVHMNVSEFVVIVLSGGTVTGAIGFALQAHFLSALAGSAVGLALPWLLLERRRQKRIKAFHDQLLDVLALIVGSLRSGHALLNALELVSKELSAPASEEFQRVLREVGFGISQTEAMDNLVKRMESEDLQLIVTAVNLTHESGGNLSQMLDKIAETIRERIRLLGEVRVLTTQQRLTTYLLVAMPVFLAIALSIMSPKYMMRMLGLPWIVIPAVAGVLELAGFLLARRLTRIEV